MDYKAQFQKESEAHEANIRNLADRANGLSKDIVEKQKTIVKLDGQIKEANDTLDNISSKIKDKYYSKEMSLGNTERSLGEREKKSNAKDAELSEREGNVKIREQTVKTDKAEFEKAKEKIKNILNELGNAIQLSIKNAVNQI